MTIDRKTLVSFHNPHLSKVELYSPLQVGNGEFAFSVDPTGVQSLYNDYNQASVPLCTMSQWGWHTTPFNETLANDYSSVQSTLELTEYVYNGRAVHYPIEKKHGNEIVYDYLRENPHRLNLARVFFKKENNELSLSDISDIDQTLNLYDGYIESNYRLCEKRMKVMTAVDAESDTILLSIEQVDKPITNLSLCVAFPYGSSNITGADWSNPKKHKLLLVEKRTNYLLVKHILDETEYYAEISINVADNNVADKKINVPNSNVVENVLIGIQDNNVSIQLPKKSDQFLVKISFSKENPVCTTEKLDACRTYDVTEVFDGCRMWWNSFWEESGAVYLRKSTDCRAVELERRIILSLYGIAVNCCGSCPPQETGLFCNSWYGKFHLEMHLWHTLALPFWNLSKLLERSFPWYLNHLQEAQKNAAFNGYKGARWPKMVAETAIDSPSPIAPLLIWQQPHILFLLESYYQCCFNNKNENTNDNSQRVAFLQKYWCLVSETADFMADFAVFNPQKNVYELVAPLIPVQEEYDPKTVLNPSFEVSYWKKGLEIAVAWAERLSKTEHAPKITLWNKIAQNMAYPPMSESNDSIDVTQTVYLSHENCPETFYCYNRDHPSMLFNYSYFADKRINKTVMKSTLNRVIKCWDYESLWGWDFAAMAMTAVRLGLSETALNLLLSETPKNTYEINGCNFQRTRNDLPSYFPGNGALLIAITMMTAGWNGNIQKFPGFPTDGTWQVEFENIVPLFD